VKAPEEPAAAAHCSPYDAHHGVCGYAAQQYPASCVLSWLGARHSSKLPPVGYAGGDGVGGPCTGGSVSYDEQPPGVQNGYENESSDA
jgi:hypothetical protein